MTSTDGAPRQDSGGLPAMTAAELRIAREDLGLTAEWLAAWLGVALRTVRRWEHGHAVIPDSVVGEMSALTYMADEQIAQWVKVLRADPEAVLRIPREGDVDGWPASWWRAAAARIIEEVEDLRVVYSQ